MARTGGTGSALRGRRFARSGLIGRPGFPGRAGRPMSAFINESRAPGAPECATVADATAH